MAAGAYLSAKKAGMALVSNAAVRSLGPVAVIPERWGESVFVVHCTWDVGSHTGRAEETGRRRPDVQTTPGVQHIVDESECGFL